MLRLLDHLLRLYHGCGLLPSRPAGGRCRCSCRRRGCSCAAAAAAGAATYAGCVSGKTCAAADSAAVDTKGLRRRQGRAFLPPHVCARGLPQPPKGVSKPRSRPRPRPRLSRNSQLRGQSVRADAAGAAGACCRVDARLAGVRCSRMNAGFAVWQQGGT
eukprot:307073-Chlamydomonas_euryale.AAC.1